MVGSLASWMEWAVVVVCFLVVVNSQTPPSEFDGIIRQNPSEPGREDAYLVPPFISNHASFIEFVQGSGSLILAWFSGTGEGQSDVAIVTSLLPQNGTQWTNASVIAQKVGFSSQNPVLYCNASNQVFAFFTQFPAGKSEGTSLFYTSTSTDGGKSFAPYAQMFNEKEIWDRNRIILTLTGDWLFPLYFSVDHGDDYSFVAVKPSTVAVQDGEKWVEVRMPKTDLLIQPTLNRIVPGQPLLRAYYRDERQKYIYTATSTDDGHSWSDAVPTELPNNNSGITSCVLASGNIALVYNPINQGRNILAISLSTDHGITWPYTRLLENFTTGEYSYPSILQTSDEVIHISYTYLRETIKYTRISESWISSA